VRRILSFVFSLSVASPCLAQETVLDPLREAARTAPNGYDAQLALGRALLEAGRYRDAQTTLSRAARLRRNDPLALYEVARVAFAQHAHQSARTQCRTVARLARDNPIGRVCQARAWLAWNRSARALEEAQAALERAPNDFEALLALGDAQRLLAAVPEAEDAYRRATLANAQSAEPHLGLGQLYAQAGQREPAIAELRRARELAPNDADVALELGRLLTGTEGVELLRAAVANRPVWADAHAALGDALLIAGQNADAEREFRAALQRDSHLASARAGLGRALMAGGDLAQAERTLREAIALVPNNAQAATALADVLGRTDRIEEAYEQYRHAADLDPQNMEPLVRGAELALAQNRPVLALAFLERVIRAQPSHAAALAMMGDLMRARNDSAQARVFYQRALRGQGPFDRARVQRALRDLR
jgi:tetratricopeptide (TPR) repeat protein